MASNADVIRLSSFVPQSRTRDKALTASALESSLLHSRFKCRYVALRDNTKNGCVADYVGEWI